MRLACSHGRPCVDGVQVAALQPVEQCTLDTGTTASPEVAARAREHALALA